MKKIFAVTLIFFTLCFLCSCNASTNDNDTHTFSQYTDESALNTDSDTNTKDDSSGVLSEIPADETTENPAVI